MICSKKQSKLTKNALLSVPIVTRGGDKGGVIGWLARSRAGKLADIKNYDILK